MASTIVSSDPAVSSLTFVTLASDQETSSDVSYITSNPYFPELLNQPPTTLLGVNVHMVQTGKDITMWDTLSHRRWWLPESPEESHPAQSDESQGKMPRPEVEKWNSTIFLFMLVCLNF